MKSLRTGALIRFLVFGLINDLFVFHAVPRRRVRRDRGLDR